jgi:hypothetical protein
VHRVHPDREHGSPRPLRALIVVVAVMATLTFGWPLVSLAVSDNRPVTPGQTLFIGSGTRSAAFTPGPDWVAHNAHTSLLEYWSLSDGPVDVSVIYVLLLNRNQVGRLWPGLNRILRLNDGSAQLGTPASVSIGDGVRGLSGPVTANDWAGQAAVFPSPNDDFAIELVSVAPPADRAAAVADEAQVSQSLWFSEHAQ